MQFGLNDEQRMLQEMAARWLADASVAGDFWQGLAEMGWLGAGFGEELGGAGGGLREMAIFHEEVGRALVEQPLTDLAVTLPYLMEQLCPERLPEIFAGEKIVALALVEVGQSAPLSPHCLWESGTLSGEKRQVVVPEGAQTVLVSARDEDGRVVIAEVDLTAAGMSRKAQRRLDGQSVETIVFAQTPARSLGLGENALSYAFAATLVAVCAEASGIAAGAFARTLDYVQTRVQFGRPIAAFQVIQHRLADLHILLEEARSLTIMACLAMNEPDERQRDAQLSSAKAGVVERALKIVREAIQLHGGVGMTEELPLGRAFRRLRVLSALYGSESWHLLRVRP